MPALSAALAVLPRPLLAFLASRLIDRLDALQGDPELEPCEAGDDGLHYFQSGHRAGWGYWQGEGSAMPEYGADQSQPPLNWPGTYHAPWGC